MAADGLVLPAPPAPLEDLSPAGLSPPAFSEAELSPPIAGPAGLSPVSLSTPAFSAPSVLASVPPAPPSEALSLAGLLPSAFSPALAVASLAALVALAVLSAASFLAAALLSGLAAFGCVSNTVSRNSLTSLLVYLLVVRHFSGSSQIGG